MANVVITAVSGKTYYKVDFGVYATTGGISYRYFWGEDIDLIDKDGHVTVHMKANNEKWFISIDGVRKTLQVDSVLGDAPTDNDELAVMIANLRG